MHPTETSYVVRLHTPVPSNLWPAQPLKPELEWSVLADKPLDDGVAFAQRLVERLGILAAGFRHIGTASA